MKDFNYISFNAFCISKISYYCRVWIFARDNAHYIGALKWAKHWMERFRDNAYNALSDYKSFCVIPPRNGVFKYYFQGDKALYIEICKRINDFNNGNRPF